MSGFGKHWKIDGLIDELRARKRELLARKRYELELQAPPAIAPHTVKNFWRFCR